jgi:hypothetical protein
MTALSTTRHMPIFDHTKHTDRVHIIGAGATGSRVFAALVELGVTNISVYDFDGVEAHNLANQIYKHSDISLSKVSGLLDWYRTKTSSAPPPEMEFHEARVNARFPAKPLDGFVFLLTDTVESRKQIFDIYLHAEQCGRIKRVIETRMAALHGTVMHFDPNDADQAQRWLKSLPNEETAEVSACGSPISVGTTASIIANLAVQQYMWLCENPAGADSRISVQLRPLSVVTGRL